MLNLNKRKFPSLDLKDKAASKGFTKIKFIYWYSVFYIVVVFLSVNLVFVSAQTPEIFKPLNNSNFTGSPISSATNLDQFKPPTCDLSGWSFLTNIFGLVCVGNYLVFFLSLAFFSSEFLIFNVILILPFGITITWMIVEVLTGSNL